jgi:hypothetical protein
VTSSVESFTKLTNNCNNNLILRLVTQITRDKILVFSFLKILIYISAVQCQIFFTNPSCLAEERPKEVKKTVQGEIYLR